MTLGDKGDTRASLIGQWVSVHLVPEGTLWSKPYLLLRACRRPSRYVVGAVQVQVLRIEGSPLGLWFPLFMALRQAHVPLCPCGPWCSPWAALSRDSAPHHPPSSALAGLSLQPG